MINLGPPKPLKPSLPMFLNKYFARFLSFSATDDQHFLLLKYIDCLSHILVHIEEIRLTNTFFYRPLLTSMVITDLFFRRFARKQGSQQDQDQLDDILTISEVIPYEN